MIDPDDSLPGYHLPGYDPYYDFYGGEPVSDDFRPITEEIYAEGPDMDFDDEGEGGGGGGVILHPFKILSIGNGTITIVPGMLNGTLALSSSGSSTEIPHVPVSSLRYLVVNVQASDTGIVSATYEVQTTAPDGLGFSENSIPTTFKLLVAILDDTVPYQALFHNLTLTPNRRYEVPKDSVSVGEYPNDIYWGWDVSI